MVWQFKEFSVRCGGVVSCRVVSCCVVQVVLGWVGLYFARLCRALMQCLALKCVSKNFQCSSVFLETVLPSL